MKHVYEYLTEIIPNFPTTHLMYLGDEDEEMISFFSNYAKEKGNVFDVRIFDCKNDKYQSIDILAPKYNTNSYQYDTLFLNLKTIPKEHLTHLFERVYASMKNAGGVVVFLPYDDDFALEIEYFLQDTNYVAVNPIDLSDNVKIVYAKKMHGWGGAR